MLHWTVHLNGGAQGSRHTAVVVENKVYCFEIENVKQRDPFGDPFGLIEVHIFNTVTLRWVKVPPVSTGHGEPPLEVPSMQPGHTAVLIEDVAYVWGPGKYDDKYQTVPMVLYAFDVDIHKWSQPKVSGTSPEARLGYSACVLGKVMYIHGGRKFSSFFDTYNDVYKIDTTTMVWSYINRGSEPLRSSDHSATIIGTKMFVFGGEWNGGHRMENLNYIRVFDTETNCWLDSYRLRTPSAQPLPYARGKGSPSIQHAAIAYNGELYIFISCREKGFDNDLWNDNELWKLNPETFSWKKVEPKGKGPSGGIRMCCCMVGHRIILFTGHDGVWVKDPLPIPTEDLYILDLSPSLKTLCKLAVIGYGLEKSGLPHNIKRELEAMTTNSN